jgi:hypothetical protein
MDFREILVLKLCADFIWLRTVSSVRALLDSVKNFVSRKRQGIVSPAEQILKSSVFWDITLCCPLKANRRFGVICLLCQTDLWLPHALTLTFSWLILRSWIWRRYVPSKRRLTFNRLHYVISQKVELFVITSVRTWILHEQILTSQKLICFMYFAIWL